MRTAGRASDAMQILKQAFAAGFDAHLGKPLEPHVLADALAKVLNVRKPG